MNRPVRGTGVIALVLALTALPAFAHATLERTSPPDGAVLAASPPVVEIRFHSAVSLTAVMVVAADKSSRRLEFVPQGSAMLFQLPRPALAAGRNRIQWKGLSKDGHVISGSFSIEIRPPAPAAH